MTPSASRCGSRQTFLSVTFSPSSNRCRLSSWPACCVRQPAREIPKQVGRRQTNTEKWNHREMNTMNRLFGRIVYTHARPTSILAHVVDAIRSDPSQLGNDESHGPAPAPGLP